MHKILCSTGALIGRSNGRNIHLLETCLEKLTCDGFEFMMYSTWYEMLDEFRVVRPRYANPFPSYQVGETAVEDGYSA